MALAAQAAKADAKDNELVVAITRAALEHEVLWAKKERDDARAVAAILVHAHDHESKPPPLACAKARSWIRGKRTEAQ